LNCAECNVVSCKSKNGHLPDYCPMHNNSDLYNRVFKLYQDQKENHNLILNSSRVESAGYGLWNRLEEIMELSIKQDFNTLGLAFCTGLHYEAKEINEILKNNNFNVHSVACKTGSISKNQVGLKEEEKVRPGKFEAMCNPISQAELLNRVETDFNILLGLCVGHDSLFIKHSKAPVTVLAVKDRVLAHNPLGAVYAKRYQLNRYNKHKI